MTANQHARAAHIVIVILAAAVAAAYIAGAFQ